MRRNEAALACLVTVAVVVGTAGCRAPVEPPHLRLPGDVPAPRVEPRRPRLHDLPLPNPEPPDLDDTQQPYWPPPSRRA
ncbi:hypothetical protein GCM10010149_04700 [Nonomuraea roseoviolacea subsp. roseoviolacea]|uniref:Lipoprotein n=1 Tax=Nonomuraea roseoviolacea subsp. carminata TaxID=160689 RepID=A0ABT1K6T2_9ACTN|nr:hypothetical protein [Nonomuraea roseoviolacea]MCP2349131.1 hypothetical protein [Nonomuraea roseoviolacea subsp. carminata]